MTIDVGIPDAAWKRARLFTASPSPPLRANGASSATMCTTRTGRPSGAQSGGGGGANAAFDPSSGTIAVNEIAGVASSSFRRATLLMGLLRTDAAADTCSEYVARPANAMPATATSMCRSSHDASGNPPTTRKATSHDRVTGSVSVRSGLSCAWSSALYSKRLPPMTPRPGTATAFSTIRSVRKRSSRSARSRVSRKSTTPRRAMLDGVGKKAASSLIFNCGVSPTIGSHALSRQRQLRYLRS